MIPGLENAQFARLGGLHRNTFLNNPKLLDKQMRLKTLPRLRFAGQVTGVELCRGSAAMGLLTGRLAAAQALGRDLSAPPPETAMAPWSSTSPAATWKAQVPADEHQLRPFAAARSPKVDEDGKRIHPGNAAAPRKRLQEHPRHGRPEGLARRGSRVTKDRHGDRNDRQQQGRAGDHHGDAIAPDGERRPPDQRAGQERSVEKL